MTSPSAWPFRDAEHWQWRWMRLGNGRLFHRVAVWEPYAPLGESGFAAMACGRAGRAEMPGVLSRMHAPRCVRCCKIAGVPLGNGAPHNEGIDG
jgi:hypothetical protein